MPPHETLTTLIPLFDGLAGHGERPALIAMTPDGRHVWSRAELHERVSRLAAGLAARLERGDTVAIYAADRPEWIAAALAAIRAGAVALPVDVQLPEETLAHVLADSGARLVFTTADRVARVARAAPDLPAWLLDAPADQAQSWLALMAEPGSLPEAAPGQTAVLFYTSGTTGLPKGVPLSHANLAFQIEAVRATGLLNGGDRVALPLPLHHVYPFVLGVLIPLSQGLPLIIPHSLTGPQVARALREGEATVMIGVPRLYAALYEGIRGRVAARGRLAAAAFDGLLAVSVAARRRLGPYLGRRLFGGLHRRLAPELRLLACGGAALDETLASRLEGLGWRVAIGYGLTETSPLLTLNLPPSARIGCAGRPVPGVELKIAAAPGEAEGEILARGPNVFAGYLKLPEKTRAAFTPDGWFRTGDVGRLEDGWLIITGRAKDLIVTAGGENVQPEEVEQAYAAHPFIQEFALLEDQGRLLGLVLPEPGAIRRKGFEAIAPAIREAVAEAGARLPSYQRVAGYAVTRDPLPRTRLGKLKRHLLRAAYDAARAEGAGPAARGALPIERMAEADRLLLEEAGPRQVWDWLATRFAQHHLAPDASLRLDLGVDSLAWLDLALEIESLCGVELTETAIAGIDTVRDLLRAVQAAPAARGLQARWDEPEQVLDPRELARIAPPGAFAQGLALALYALNRVLMRRLFRLRVEGLELLPAGPFVLAPNHVSYLDPFAVGAALPIRILRRTCAGGWTGVAFTNPVTRALSRLARVLPVEPQRGAMSALALGAAVLKRGDNLLWFPEGRRSASGELQPFRPGIGLLLARFPVPVVPVHIRGSFAALPPGRRWPRFVSITIRFGAPLDPAALAGASAGDEAAQRITQALRDQVAELGGAVFPNMA